MVSVGGPGTFIPLLDVLPGPLGAVGGVGTVPTGRACGGSDGAGGGPRP